LAKAYLLVIANISFRHPEIFHGEFADQGRVPKSLLEEHDDRFVINLQDDVHFFAEALNNFPEGLSLLLSHVRQVPIDSWPRACGSEVTDKLSVEVEPGAD
jgi:hypothetical protein